MYSLVVSKLNNNDESCVLLNWLAEDGQMVQAQQMVAILETSKATFDLVSETAGVLQRVAQVGDEIQFGNVVAYVFESAAERETFLVRSQPALASNVASLNITKMAQALIEQHQIPEADILALGKTVITKADIEALNSTRASTQKDVVALSRRQVAIAELVSRSHQTIPTSFTVMKICCDPATEMLVDFMRQHDVLVGLPELLVSITARLSAEFPLFFGRLTDENTIILSAHPGIGITFDVGKGLFIPVVKDAASRSLQEIADTLMDFRVKAFRNTFREDDFSDGHLTISLSGEQNILFVMPIILASQVAMLSLSSILEELTLMPDGTPTTRHFIHLGLAYDHRVVNGYEAVEFLKAIKTQLESPQDAIA